MKLTYNWLKDFVEVRIPAKQLADKLTMAGLEVTSFEEKEGDFVFEIEITSNRPDWLSVIGIARETAAITNLKFSVGGGSAYGEKNKKLNTKKDYFKIVIENKKDCPLYTAKIIDDVKVAASADWLKKRLELIGCRSINNVVDITNYILFTWGEPLHAFDLDKIKNSINVSGNDVFTIVVRRARNSEEIVAIDGIKRTLNGDILVIAAENSNGLSKPVAIAGVMGGKETEVTEQTKNILLEAAIFDPIVIRRTRQKLGISTDSSYRFERGVDLETAKQASFEAKKLIEEKTGGKYILHKEIDYTKSQNKIIDLELNFVTNVLGTKISIEKIKNILLKLGFGVNENPLTQPLSPLGRGKRVRGKKKLNITVPSFRQDVKIERDLIEEIARIYGYENIPLTLPALMPSLIDSRQTDLVLMTKNILTALGLNEVITYSLIEQKMLDEISFSKLEAIQILNPLSKEQEILRPTIIANLLKTVAYNLNQKQEPVNIFEIANIYLHQGKGDPEEELVLGIAMCGEKSRVYEEGRVREKMGVLHLKGILGILFERLGINNFILDEKNNASEIMVNAGKEKIGVIHLPPKNTLDNFDIKNREVVIAELYLSRILGLADLKKKFKRLPLYPGISRDISFVIGEEVKVKDVLTLIQDKAGDLLKDVRVTDYYKGRQIPNGFKGLTISCLYRSDERTLTEDEIAPLHSLICRELADKFNVQLRR